MMSVGAARGAVARILFLGVLFIGGSARAEGAAGGAADVVIDIGGTKTDSAELLAQLGWESESVIAHARSDENAARNLAINWYEAELLARAAADDGILAGTPGLAGAARNVGRRLVVRTYVENLMAKELAPDKTDLQSYYAMYKERCAVPLRLRVAQMGVRIGTHASEAEREAARKRLDAMKARVDAGEAFAAVADDASDIPGRKPGGEMGWFTVEELGQQAGAAEIAATPAGRMTAPITTELGLQIYQVAEKQEPRTKTYEECREELSALIDGDYRKAAVRRRVDDLARRYNASMNIDAFIAAVRKARGKDVSPASPGPDLDTGSSITETKLPR